MKLKMTLAASTALALVAAAPGAQAGDLYISVFGGANFQSDSSGVAETGPTPFLTVEEEWSTTADTGFVLGGAIGTHLDKWAKGLRVEVEGSYRRNDIRGRFAEYSTTDTDGGTIVTTSEQGPINANMSTFALLANVWYEFDIGTKFRPYVGGGIGWSRMQGDMVAVSTTGNGSVTGIDTHTEISASGFAWQLGFGLNYEVAPGVDLGMGYRYFKGPKFEPFFEEVNALENENHSVQVNLTFGIN